MTRTLVIGYGNPSRRDDGVGQVVINGLRSRLGLPALDESDDGSQDLGGELDTLCLQQLSPELAELLAAYDQVVFVDAHAGVPAERVRRVTLQPQARRTLVSHHMAPEQLLALALQLHGRAPAAELISIHGSDFDFGVGLSEATAQDAGDVVQDLWQRFGR